LTPARAQAHPPRVLQHISGAAGESHTPDDPYHHPPMQGLPMATKPYITVVGVSPRALAWE